MLFPCQTICIEIVSINGNSPRIWKTNPSKNPQNQVGSFFFLIFFKKRNRKLEDTEFSFLNETIIFTNQCLLLKRESLMDEYCGKSEGPSEQILKGNYNSVNSPSSLVLFVFPFCAVANSKSQIFTPLHILFIFATWISLSDTKDFMLWDKRFWILDLKSNLEPSCVKFIHLCKYSVIK